MNASKFYNLARFFQLLQRDLLSCIILVLVFYAGTALAQSGSIFSKETSMFGIYIGMPMSKVLEENPSIKLGDPDVALRTSYDSVQSSIKKAANNPLDEYEKLHECPVLTTTASIG